MKYLAAKYNVADHWHPKDLRKQARVDEYLNWYHLNTRINAAFVFRTQVSQKIFQG
jgi:glutathione S-transferase